MGKRADMTPKEREEIKAYHAAYRAAHREEIKAYHAAYRAAHREEIKAQRAAYRAAHREEIKAYRVAHREEIKARDAKRIWIAGIPFRNKADALAVLQLAGVL